jgi:hypothetical protein
LVEYLYHTIFPHYPAKLLELITIELKLARALLELAASDMRESPWRAANLGRSRLFRRPEPAESRLRAELPALQLQTDPLPAIQQTPKARPL